MRSALPKVLHEVAGLPMVCHAVRTAEAAGGEAHAVVVGREAQKVEAAVRAVTGAVTFHEQTRKARHRPCRAGGARGDRARP